MEHIVFNKITGQYVDLTREQFDLYNIEVAYEPNETMQREYCCKIRIQMQDIGNCREILSHI